jgi:HEAT repeat protein
VRRSAAAALGRIGPAGEQAILALTGALRDSDSKVQKAAADALGQIGPAASSAIPALERLSQQSDPCNSAQSALKKIRQ